MATETCNMELITDIFKMYHKLRICVCCDASSVASDVHLNYVPLQEALLQ